MISVTKPFIERVEQSLGLKRMPIRRLFYVSGLPKTIAPGLKTDAEINPKCLRGDRKCPPGDEGGPSGSPEAEIVIIAESSSKI